jgi:hypothetical protein
MSDLRKLIGELSDREMTRKLFLALVGGGFLGMIGIFRFLQEASTPDLANSDRGVFGEKEYGHQETAKAAATDAKPKTFNQDVFG